MLCVSLQGRLHTWPLPIPAFIRQLVSTTNERQQHSGQTLLQPGSRAGRWANLTARGVQWADGRAHAAGPLQAQLAPPANAQSRPPPWPHHTAPGNGSKQALAGAQSPHALDLARMSDWRV